MAGQTTRAPLSAVTLLLAGSTIGCVSRPVYSELVATEPGVRAERRSRGVAPLDVTRPPRPVLDGAADPLETERASRREEPASFPHPRPAPFSKGSRRFETYGSAVGGDPGKGEMYALHAGVEYFLRDYLALSTTLFGAYVRSGIDDNGGAGGFDLVLRRHVPGSADDSVSLFVDAGAGCQQQSTNFSGPRHFNFRLIVGVGATFALGDRWGLIAGIRYLHISDAGIEGGGGGYDGPMGYAGVTFGIGPASGD